MMCGANMRRFPSTLRGSVISHVAIALPHDFSVGAYFLSKLLNVWSKFFVHVARCRSLFIMGVLLHFFFIYFWFFHSYRVLDAVFSRYWYHVLLLHLDNYQNCEIATWVSAEQYLESTVFTNYYMFRYQKIIFYRKKTGLFEFKLDSKGSTSHCTLIETHEYCYVDYAYL